MLPDGEFGFGPLRRMTARKGVDRRRRSGQAAAEIASQFTVDCGVSTVTRLKEWIREQTALHGFRLSRR